MGWYEEMPEIVVEWKAKADTITFMGESITGMSGEKLMAVIGFMAIDAEQDRKRHEQSMSLMGDFNGVRAKIAG